MKKIIVLFSVISSLCLLSKISNAQTPKWKWAEETEGESIAVDTSGNIYAAGFNLTKYDTTGNVIWTRLVFSGQGELSRISVTVDTSGNIYETGTFLKESISLGKIPLKNADNTGNTTDFFLAKFDENGKVNWAKRAGGTNIDGASSIAVDASGYIYVAGYFTSQKLDFGGWTTFPLNNADNTDNTSDLFLAKFDAKGKAIWAKSAGGTKDDAASSIAVDASGNVYMAGSFNSKTLCFGYDTLKNIDATGNTSDFFLAKYDDSGKVLWAKSVGEMTHNAKKQSVAIDASGNAYLEGNYYSNTLYFGSDTLKNADRTGNTSDIFLAKYDAKGNVLWAKSAGGTKDDEASSIAVDASGNAYITGNYGSNTLYFGSTTLKNIDTTGNTSALFLTKYDNNGKVLWAKSLGGINPSPHFFNYNVEASSIAVDASRNVYLVGDFHYGNLIFDSPKLTLKSEKATLGNVTNSTFFLAKLPGIKPKNK